MIIAMCRGRRSCGTSSVGSAPSPAIGWSHFLDGDRLLALRANRNHTDRLPDELAHSTQILPRIGRQLFISAACGDLFLPARQRFVNRLGVAKIIHMARELIGIF